MKPIKNSHLSLNARIGLGFASILLLLLALTGVGIVRVNVIERGSTEINDVNSVKQRYAINFRGSVHDRAIALRDVTLVTGDAELCGGMAQVDKLAADYSGSAASMKKTFEAGHHASVDETRSADTAKQIKSLISASVERVAQGSELVDKAGTTLQDVVASIRRVTDLMGEISTASIQQSAAVSQVGEAVTQMDKVMQQNAALVEESAQTVDSLSRQAQQLVTAMAVFRLSESPQPSHATAAA